MSVFLLTGRGNVRANRDFALFLQTAEQHYGPSARPASQREDPLSVYTFNAEGFVVGEG